MVPRDINASAAPDHVAIIMDGNGRWAARRGLPRSAGHRQGAEAVRRVVEAAAEAGIKIVTLFGFSSENWSRPQEEVAELMKLLRYYLRSETAELHKKGVRLRVIGDRAAFDHDIIELIEHAEALTVTNEKITLVIALNYGGRHDILTAAYAMGRFMAERQDQTGQLPDLETCASAFPGFLMTSGLPDPDLLIRTSGEQRISNFLLWQCAYAEFIYTDVLWPDFGKQDLLAALDVFYARDRRYGGLGRAAKEPASKG